MNDWLVYPSTAPQSANLVYADSCYLIESVFRAVPVGKAPISSITQVNAGGPLHRELMVDLSKSR